MLTIENNGVAIVARSSKRHASAIINRLANYCHRLPSTYRTALNGCINSNLPRLLLRADARGRHFAANLNHIVANLISVLKHIGNDVDAITFSHRRKIKANAVFGFINAVIFLNDTVKIDQGFRLRNLKRRWRTLQALNRHGTAKAPSFYQRHYRWVKSTAGQLINLP